EPLVGLDHVAVQAREDGRGAADGQKGEHQEMEEQRAEGRTVHHSASFQAATIATGASTPMTPSSDQRRTPTPAKASPANSHGRHCRGRTAAIRTPLASRSPAPTADMPVSA